MENSLWGETRVSALESTLSVMQNRFFRKKFVRAEKSYDVIVTETSDHHAALKRRGFRETSE